MPLDLFPIRKAHATKLYEILYTIGAVCLIEANSGGPKKATPGGPKKATPS